MKALAIIKTRELYIKNPGINLFPGLTS